MKVAWAVVAAAADASIGCCCCCCCQQHWHISEKRLDWKFVVEAIIKTNIFPYKYSLTRCCRQMDLACVCTADNKCTGQRRPTATAATGRTVANGRNGAGRWRDQNLNEKCKSMESKLDQRFAYSVSHFYCSRSHRVGTNNLVDHCKPALCDGWENLKKNRMEEINCTKNCTTFWDANVVTTMEKVVDGTVWHWQNIKIQKEFSEHIIYM